MLSFQLSPPVSAGWKLWNTPFTSSEATIYPSS